MKNPVPTFVLSTSLRSNLTIEYPDIKDSIDDTSTVNFIPKLLSITAV